MPHLNVAMERKSWSWTKKVFEKLASSRVNSSSDSTPQTADNYSKEYAEDLIRSQFAFKEQLNAPDGTCQTDIKLRILSEQLMARDELAQQHAKVAEEAVIGWEKAECEAACLKQQLDEEILYKAAMEEQLVRLEKSLKDNVGKLQHAEERELRLQKLLEAKSQELNSLHSEMESTMSKVVNEMARAAKEADARSGAEDKVNMLQKRVDTVEKEQTNLRYELQIVAKELDIRNEELELSKQAAENANDQHLENVKLIAKLEDDCHRLQLLLQKRNPGPAIIAHMRIEGEAFSPTMLDRGSYAMSPSSRFCELYMDSTGRDASRDLERRMVSIEEENKSLKEALTKKDGELQSARLLCAKTATKLSAAQEQLEKALQPRPHALFHRSTKSALDGHTTSSLERAFLCNPEDESNCAESWASALITELAQIRMDKEKDSRLPGADLMKDFVEMEKLALRPFENQEKVLGEECIKGRYVQASNQADSLKELAISKGNLQGLPNDLRSELQTKLSSVENELYSVKAENMVTKAALSSIEKHLVAILQAETDDRASKNDLFEEVRAALDTMYKHLTDSNVHFFALYPGMDSQEVRDATAWSPVGQSSCRSEDVPMFKQEAKSSPKRAHVGQKLCTAVHRVVWLFEELAQTDWKEDVSSDASDMLARIHTEKLWKTSEFECCIRSLIMICNGVLEEKVDVSDFLEEVASALEWLVNRVYVSSEKLPNAQRQLEFSKPEHHSRREQASLRELRENEHDNKSIEEQLTQLKSEKEGIDAKLCTMTRELELLKSVLQDPEENVVGVNASLLGTRDGDENIASPKIKEDTLLKKLHSYRSNMLVGVSKGIQRHQYQNLLHPNEMYSASSEHHQTHFTMVSDIDEVSMDAEEGVKKPDKEEELDGHSEKLVDRRKTIMLLEKKLEALGMPRYVSETVPSSDHVSVKSGKAQRQAHRSFDQLHTIREDSSLYEDKKIGHPRCDITLSNAMACPDLDKDNYEFQRDPAVVDSPAKSIRSKSEMKVDSSQERHAAGLSRFSPKASFLLKQGHNCLWI